MTDRIDKNLQKLSPKQRTEVQKIVSCILEGKIQGLDLKKLRGSKDVYRVRKGKLRIIFYMPDTKEIRILAIESRSDTTYNAF